MKGGYMPKEQRDQLALQVRRTHFTLGHGGPDYATTSGTNYDGKQGGPEKLNRDQLSNLRRSHFALGINEGSHNVLSEFKHRYPPHGYNVSSLNEGVKADLRRHHFDFGTEGMQYDTTASASFAKPGVQQSSALPSDHLKNIRKHNFHFGEDKVKPESITRSDFGPKTAQMADTSAVRRDLRASHFLLGSALPDYTSTAAGDFSSRPAHPSALNTAQLNDLRSCHFKLGTDAPNFNTTVMSNFGPKTDGKQALNQEKLQDLRSSHFKLGHDPIDYAASSHLAHKALDRPSTIGPTQSSNGLRASHFALGTDPLQWQSMYSTAHANRDLTSSTGARDRNADRQSHIVIGSSDGPMQSEMQANFIKHNEAPNKLDPALAKDLRSHHFDLGEVEPDFGTSYAKYGSQQGAPGQIDPTMLADLRATHFKYGTDDPQFSTTFRGDYTKHSHKPESMDQGLVKNLRGHHFELGGGPKKYNTTYRGSYLWVQPVPDNDYKFSFE
jgi:hypothetical protein